MSETSQFLISHGLPIVFAAVFVEQMGLPLPAIPWLLAAGALSATGNSILAWESAAAVVACLIADGILVLSGPASWQPGAWASFAACRLEPDSCVRRTLNVFTRYGMPGVVVAKFLPGMSTITPPLAGMSGFNAGRFLLFDGAGLTALLAACSSCWAISSANQIDTNRRGDCPYWRERIEPARSRFPCYTSAYKYWQRQRLLHELRMARITVEELREKQDAGESPVILDMRSRAELELDPSIISGAIHLGVDEIAKRHHEFPRDRDIIVYCWCPNEVTARGWL